MFHSFLKDSCITNGAASFGQQAADSFVCHETESRNVAEESRDENWHL